MVTIFDLGLCLIIDRSNVDPSVIGRPDGVVGPIIVTERLLRLTRLCSSLMSGPLVLTLVSVVLYPLVDLFSAISFYFTILFFLCTEELKLHVPKV